MDSDVAFRFMISYLLESLEIWCLPQGDFAAAKYLFKCCQTRGRAG